MHGRNFSLVPYIGETGAVERKFSTTIRHQGSRLIRDVRPHLVWRMSSQVKYGRDGNAYALHQLHCRTSITVAPRRSSYVPPVIEARLDLRTVVNPANSLVLRMQGEFIDRVERALIHPDGRMVSDAGRMVEHGHMFGLQLGSAVGRFGRIVKVMDQAWRKRTEHDEAAHRIAANYFSINGQITHKT